VDQKERASSRSSLTAIKLDRNLTKSWLNLDDFKRRHELAAVEEHPNSVLRTTNTPLASVIIVTFQHAEYIRDAIESVLIQKTRFPFEIILGDDESTDGTRDICIEYAKRFPDTIRLFLHKRQNNIRVLGQPSGIFQIAYNIFHCRGSYVALSSGDDYWQDDRKLQIQVDFLDKHPDVSYTYHDHIRLFPETGETQGPYSVDRIQTIVGRNIFQKLPEQFLRVMQEDSFLKFFWRQAGQSVHIEGIDPAVVRFHSSSMYTSLDGEKTFRQRINLWRQILAACQHQADAKKRASFGLTATIFYHYWNDSRLRPLNRIKLIVTTLAKEKHLLTGMVHLLRLGVNRVNRLIRATSS
jgi:glycosyltransferase involved in cell wall biosynthesis